MPSIRRNLEKTEQMRDKPEEIRNESEEIRSKLTLKNGIKAAGADPRAPTLAS